MRAQRYLWYFFSIKIANIARVTTLLENIRDSEQSRENWIACARKLGKRKRWELICDEARQCGASSAHTVSRARLSLSDRCSESAKRHGMSAQKRQDKQKDKGVVYWQSRQTPVRTIYTTRSRTGLAYRWNPSKAEFHPSSTCHFHFLPIAKYDVTSCAQPEKKNFRNDEWTWEVLCRTLIHGDNFCAISLLAVSATILARIFNIKILRSLSRYLFH